MLSLPNVTQFEMGKAADLCRMRRDAIHLAPSRFSFERVAHQASGVSLFRVAFFRTTLASCSAVNGLLT